MSYPDFHFHQKIKTLYVLLPYEVWNGGKGTWLETHIWAQFCHCVWHWTSLWIVLSFNFLTDKARAMTSLLGLLWGWCESSLKSDKHIHVKGSSETCLPIGMIFVALSFIKAMFQWSSRNLFLFRCSCTHMRTLCLIKTQVCKRLVLSLPMKFCGIG